MKLRHAFAPLVLILGIATSAYSQAVSSLRGTVTDSSGFVILRADVVLSNPERGFQQSLVTDANGNYVFNQVPPGTYDLKVSASHFAPYGARVTLLVQQPTNLNVKLRVGAVSEQVEVRGLAEALNTTDASIGTALDNATIKELPIEGRNVPDLLSLQPGVLYLGRQVNATTDSRSGSVSGARSDQSNLTLDGVDNNDQLQGLAFTGVLRSTMDSVQEFRVTTTGTNADSGRSSGGQVTLVTKSGTNKFHGSLYEYNRNRLFAANDWFNKNFETAAGFPNKPGQLIRNTFGTSVGGPIKKNKAFFFLNYEGQRTAENVQLQQPVPTSTMRNGIVKYLAQDGSVVTLQPSDLLAIDHNCGANCPWPGGGGNDPNILPVLQSYPLPNLPGTGDGLNIENFTFSAPDPGSLNTYIAKFDVPLYSANQLFVRGTLQGDRQLGTPQFPGQPASSTTTTNSKGFVVGDTWTISSHVVNNLRYGFVRQGIGNRGIANQSYVSFGDIPFTGGLANPVAETRTTLTNVPVHNLVEDLAWVKGKHTLQFGGNFRRVTVNSVSDATSYYSAATGANNYATGQLYGTGQDLDPGAFGYPAVLATFGTSYDVAATTVDGVIDTINHIYNYHVAPRQNSSTLLPIGAMIPRSYRDNEFEWYAQDSWRVKPNLTITLGLRHTLLQAPFEVNGQQISPTASLNDWFHTRGSSALQGQSAEPLLSLSPSGSANGRPGYWAMNKLNFDPRIAVAYSPSFDQGFMHHLFGVDKTSLRMGLGLVHDHFGQGIAQAISTTGSLGLSTGLGLGSIVTTDNEPRFTGLTDIPNIFSPPPATQTYPYVPPETSSTQPGFTTSFGVDDKMHTPYSISATASVERELRGGFTFEAAYVGRFGRHLLQQTDAASPVDLVDPASGMDYFTAAALMGKAVASGATTINPIPYWQNVWGAMASGNITATQNIFNGNQNPSPYYSYAGNPVTPISVLLTLDVFCNTTNPSSCLYNPGRYFSLQYGDLFAWFPIGSSSYNAGEFSLRKQLAHGLQANVSYTYSKSMDIGSDAERSAGTGGGLGGSTAGTIFNGWLPGKNRAVSDFDTTHIVNGDANYELPFGKGKALGANANPALDAFIGGWSLGGLWKWTSGLPFSINGPGYPSSYWYHSYMVQTGRIETKKNYLGGQPQVFADPGGLTAAAALSYPTTPEIGFPWRLPYAGEIGNRNNFRGDGYFTVDTALAKSWDIREGKSLKLTWEVFNVTNSVRFDVKSINNVESVGGFGNYTSLLTAPRVQQVSLRFEF
ncbi:MAG TPA: carboxypeptidase-like regulatory domain-containing protein [Terriglobales bacterium]|nr:carboxypeptidase-like regulatory domain-containing protein [Terriglobales bacterium]